MATSTNDDREDLMFLLFRFSGRPGSTVIQSAGNNNIGSCLYVLTSQLWAITDNHLHTCRPDTTRTHSHMVAASSKQRSKSALPDAPMPGQYTLPGSNWRPSAC